MTAGIYTDEQLFELGKENYDKLALYCQTLETSGFWDKARQVMQQSSTEVLDMYVQSVLMNLAIHCGNVLDSQLTFIQTVPISNPFAISPQVTIDEELKNDTEKMYHMPPILIQLCSLYDKEKGADITEYFLDGLLNILLCMAYLNTGKDAKINEFIQKYYNKISYYVNDKTQDEHSRYIFGKISGDEIGCCIKQNIEERRKKRAAMAGPLAVAKIERPIETLPEESLHTEEKKKPRKSEKHSKKEKGQKKGSLDESVREKNTLHPEDQLDVSAREKNTLHVKDNVDDSINEENSLQFKDNADDSVNEQDALQTKDSLGDATKEQNVLQPKDNTDERLTEENNSDQMLDLSNLSEEEREKREQELREKEELEISAQAKEQFLQVKKRIQEREQREKEAHEKRIQDLLDELNGLVGLDNVKEEIQSLINLIKIRKLRSQMNIPEMDMSYHMVFTGSPGTGKTTVARLVAKIYKELGILSEGKVIETDRSGLVAGYVGQTAMKVHDIVEQALGGILFIDEAYSLVNPDVPNDFGSEAVDALVKLMEDHRDNLIVIVAGYTEEMKTFLKSNTGLISRFNKFIEFKDYTKKELVEILEVMTKEAGLEIEESAKKRVLNILYHKKGQEWAEFGNARGIRNFFEKIVMNQANRLVKMENPQKEDLITLKKEDVVYISQ